MRVKIDFTKLLYEWYYHFDIEICLEMINWFFATGLEGDYEVKSGWHKSGINQLLYGYSACNHDVANPFPINSGLREFITAIFVRAIVSPTSWDGKGKIAEWRKNNNIELGKYRFFDFPVSKRKEKNPCRNDTRYYLHRVADYEGKELKKKYFHPDYPNRTKPRIIKVTFSTYGKGYFVDIDFSFWEFNYEPGWTEEIAKQKPGEHIGDFLARAERKLKMITVNTEATERLAFETKHNFKTFSEKGCFNCILLRHDDKENYCGMMAFYKRTKSCAIDVPNNHYCDHWRFQYEDDSNPQNYITWGEDKA
jgi:hypothetical protein